MLTAFTADPTFQALQAAKPVLWRNPHWRPFAQAAADVGFTLADVQAAEQRWQRFAPYLAAAFPETAAAGGRIESPLYALPTMQQALGWQGDLWLKADSELPIAGSIKARGGIYEVLQWAETLARQHGLLHDGDDYTRLAQADARALFARYTVAVGSTGNLGLSIGMMAARLGFQAAVHMSADARQWKKDMLRAHGVQVFEYAGDYGAAVAQGRAQAAADPYAYFVDDEQSRHLFLGYAVGGWRLSAQLAAQGIVVDAAHPLFVYLPCGVGGGPGGVAFGLKLAFGDAVQCVFVEPTQSPCVLLGVLTGLHDGIAVEDIGLHNRTAADGLAVGRASGFVGRALQRSLHAFCTVDDATLFRYLRLAYETQQQRLEPSACAGFAAVPYFDDVPGATHLVWATGGGLVPEDIFAQYLAQA